jgi:hypothetical protein
MTKQEIIKRLRALSEEMQEVGTAIDYYYGFNPLAAHGAEMVGAGMIAAEWADEMEKENAIDMESMK